MRWLIALVLTMIVSISSAQSPGWKLSATIGGVRNYQDSSDPQPQYALYPELMISRSLLVGDLYLVSLGAYVSGWDDGVSILSECLHCTTHRYRAMTVGARGWFGLRPAHVSLQLELGAAIGRQFVDIDYLGGGPYGGSNRSGSFWIIEVGAQALVPVRERLRLGGRLLGQVPLGGEVLVWKIVRPSFGLEIQYDL